MFRRLRHFFEFLFRRSRLEDDLDEELRSSFDMVVDRLVAAGMSPEAARRKARLEFEGFAQVKDSIRDGLVGSGFQTFVQDISYACRGLLRRRSFAVVSLLTLALGIGVNTAIFSVFHAVLLRPLPYAEPQQLVLIWASTKQSGTARGPVSGKVLREIKSRNRSFTRVAGIWTGTGTFEGDNPEQVRVAQVTPDFFDVLGVSALHGRTFVKEEEAGGRSAMVLTDGFFRRRFAGNTSLIGTALPLKDWGPALVGVLPADFQLHFAPDANVPADVQAFAPFPYDIYASPSRVSFIRVVARLKPGLSVEQARQDMSRVAADMRAAFTEFSAADLRFNVVGMHADSVREVESALTALFAGSAFVLLICCVNVASLLLARASERRREMALRLALGASRGRILRQLFAEGGVLCLLGCAGGIALGWAGFRGLLAIRPERFARIGEADLNWAVLAFAAIASFSAAMLFSMAPALESFRLDFIAALRSGGRACLAPLQRRAGAVLVIGEIMLGFVLVTCAALAARTLSKIEQVHPGFEPRNLLTFQLTFGGTLSPDIPPGRIGEWERQIAALPGVERIGATSHLPLDDFPNWYMPYRPEGLTEDRMAGLVADMRCITPGYLPAMGVRLLEGRYFNDGDRAGSEPVIVIDESVARSVWPHESALGRRIVVQRVVDGGFKPVSSVVVGIAEHVHNHSLTRQLRGQIYVPFEQSSRSPLTFAVRTGVDPLSLVRPIRDTLRGAAPGVPMAKVRPMTEYIDRERSPATFTAVLAGMFAALALLLAATGIYGVFNYQVSRRLPEMGIRMALGAGVRDVFRLVIGEGLALAAAGVTLGAAVAFLSARWLGSLLYGVAASDPLSFAAGVVILPCAALLACCRPAWRAAAASPTEIMRQE